MKRLLESCAALDVHKKQLAACVRVLGAAGEDRGARRRVLDDDFAAAHVAGLAQGAQGRARRDGGHGRVLEAGVLGAGGRVRGAAVNGQHVNNVPSRKTDTRNAQWLCQLSECGLLRASFVPPKPIRELRDLTRYREALIQERTREANRLHEVLGDAAGGARRSRPTCWASQAG